MGLPPPSKLIPSIREDTTTGMTTSPWRVWLLEDSALEAGFAMKALESRCHLAVFSDGGALLEQLAMESEPELLVLDYVLPGLSGIEVCRFVRQTRDRVTLPILMLTGNSSEDLLIECLEAGANDFVTKPFRAPELLARVETLGGVSRHAALSRQKHAADTAALVRGAEEAAQRVHAKMVEQDRYIGILGHDLRNPLSAIMMAAAMLERNPDSVTRRAARIRRSAARMALMISDVLDFARGRLDSGVPIQPRPTDMRAICADIVDELGEAHPDREIMFEVNGDVTGVWDPDRLQQAISNLVGNALEHSDSVVTIRMVGADANVAVMVHNAGAAIPAADIPLLFEAFRKRNQHGTGLGLGLYIVKEIARAHGGTASVDSTDACGTTFTIVVPRTAPSVASR
jgi:signal transduction histidine kinase